MADDPTKKKQEQSGGADSVAAMEPPKQDLSVDEFNDRISEQFRKGKPTEGSPEQTPDVTPASSWWDSIKGTMTKQRDPGEFVKGVARGAVNIAKDVGNTAGDVGDSLTKLGGSDPATAVAGGVGQAMKLAGKLAGATDKAENAVIGRRSDDPVAAFAEDATEFIGGFYATGRLPVGSGNLAQAEHAASWAVRSAIGMARGAAVDFATNPHVDGLAELAAKSPVPLLKPLGELLSVNGDDSQIVARLKRSTAGMIPGVALDGLVATTRLIRSGKVLAKDAGNVAARETAEQAAGTLEAIQNGTHAGEGDAFRLTKTPDGQPQIVTNGNGGTLRRKIAEAIDPSIATERRALTRAAETDPLTGVGNRASFDKALPAAEADPNTSIVHFDANNFGKINKTSGMGEGDKAIKDVAAAVKQAATEHGVGERVFRNGGDEFSVLVPKAKADAVRARAEELFGERTYGEHRVSLTGTHGDTFLEAENGLQAAKNARKAAQAGVIDPSSSSVLDEALAPQKAPIEMESTHLPTGEEKGPVFSDMGEAQAQLETLNQAAEAKTSLNVRGSLTEQQMNDVTSAFSHFLNTKDPAEVQQLLDGTHFNFSYQTEPKEAVAAIEALSKVFNEQITKAQGEVPIEESVKMVNKLLGTMGEQEAPVVLNEVLKGASSVPLHVRQMAADVVLKSMGKKLAAMNAILEARPLDAVAHEEARVGLRNWLALQETLAGSNSETGRALRFMQERGQGHFDGDIKFGEQTAAQIDEAAVGKHGAKPSGVKEIHPLRKPKKTVEDLGIEKSGEADLSDLTGSADEGGVGSMKSNRDTSIKQSVKDTPDPDITAGMTHREIRDLTRLVRMSNGEPRLASGVVNAAKVLAKTHKPGVGRAVYETFVNFVLSNPVTWGTVATSGATLNAIEPMFRAMAGAVTGNTQLAREGLDIAYGNFKYLGDNVKSMAMAMRAGRSVLDPAPMTYAIGGLTGEVVRTPGRVMSGLDEFTRVTGYRSYVRAKSLRLGREQGLAGAALEQRVERDLANAFVPEGHPGAGMATLPEALKYADVATLSGPLKHDSFSAGFRTFVNNKLETRFIAPFIKASANIFDYVWKSAPGLNLLNNEARAIMKEGGEEAALLHTRSVVAGSLYGFGLYQAMNGNITGGGPKEPNSRKLWLKDHQPYSVKVNGEWVSFLRADPLATPLGIMGDLADALKETQDESHHNSLEDVAYGLSAALIKSITNRTYLRSVADFMDMASSGNANKLRTYVSNMAASIAVPGVVTAASSDPYYREVRSTLDAVRARIPGISESLMPQYDIFGEPRQKPQGPLERVTNPFRTQAVTRNVESDLLDLNKTFAPVAIKSDEGIDLSSKEYTNETGKRPYERLMELIRSPEDGSPPLREAMTDLVKDPSWQDWSSGSAEFPGGERYARASRLKEKYERRAMKQVRDEFPKLDEAMRRAREAKRAAFKEGDAGVQEVNDSYNLLKQASK